MILGKSSRQSIILNIINIKIKESLSVIFLLGFTIDNWLTFKHHTDTLWCFSWFQTSSVEKNKELFNYWQDKTTLQYIYK